MRSNIISREKEIKILEEFYTSNIPELLALYGRRRVGKTFLVRSFFERKKQKKQKEIIFLDITGMQNGFMAEQIRNFTDALGTAFVHQGARLEAGKNWYESFRILSEYIKLVPEDKKIVLFFDEFPWMVTKNSKLLQFLEYYWNHDWSKDNRIKLIICGSSAGWILKNIINNTKGLYNRVTRTIQLEPFDLQETKKYLFHKGIRLNNRQVAELYMVLGGIPHYLNQVTKGLSATQVIEQLAFVKKGFLLDEFEKLYATLLHDAKNCIEIIRLIAQHRYGIGQQELLEKISDVGGGSKIKLLDDLENAGLIMKFKSKWNRKRGIYYIVTDEYSLFYLYWIEPIKETLLVKGLRKGYWEKTQLNPSWHIWKGYAFEALCYKHLAKIGDVLSLSPTAIPGTWKYVPKRNKAKTKNAKNTDMQGTQIDLLFDRDDDVITICEIKYTKEPFIIDKQYAHNLINKTGIFRRITKTTKQIFIAIISANGLKPSIYSEEMISNVVTLDDFFKE